MSLGIQDDTTKTLASRVAAMLPAGVDIGQVISQFDAYVGREIDEIVSLRDAGLPVIPEIKYSELSKTGFSTELEALVRKRGCLVVREVVSKARATNWNDKLEHYIRANCYFESLESAIKQGDAVRGKFPYMLDIYWSQSQLEIRQSKQIHKVQQRLNSLWLTAKSGDGAFNPDKSLSYADRVRIRQPGNASDNGIAAHVDSCSLEPWFTSDSIWRSYKSIFTGDWQSFDSFDAVGRVSTEQKPHVKACSVFRTYQGWLGLTPQGEGGGTLQLVPSSLCVAWLFIKLLEASRRNEELNFPLPGQSYNLHPEKHAALLKAVCPIPNLNAGDTIWWHPDVVHSVEGFNSSNASSNVAYLGVAPDCARNNQYMQQQLKAFNAGLTPPDFPAVNNETGYLNRGVRENLTSLGEEKMGYSVEHFEALA